MPVPELDALNPSPELDGPLAELSFGRLTQAVDWVLESVKTLEQGLFKVAGAMGDDAIIERMASLEASQEEMQDNLRDQIQAILNDPVQPVVLAPEAKKERELPPFVSPEEHAALTEEVNALKVDLENCAGKLDAQEALENTRPHPLADIHNEFTKLGLAGGPDQGGVACLGNLFVTIKNDITSLTRNMMKDLENQKQELEDKIAQVEQEAAADAEVRSKAAADETSKLEVRIEKVEKRVQALEDKNKADGDVAGGLRDVVLRVEAIEEREQEAEEARQAEEERKAKLAASRKKKQGGPITLESLAEVDLTEEVMRLRRMIESMEAAMPQEAKQTIAFFKRGAPGANDAGNAGATTGGGGGGISGDVEDEDLVQFRAATDEIMAKHQANQKREHQHLLLKMKAQERDLGSLDAKVDDMWRRLPKVIALLEPMQAFIDGTGALGQGSYLGEGVALPSDDVSIVLSGPGTGRTGSHAEASPPSDINAAPTTQDRALPGDVATPDSLERTISGVRPGLDRTLSGVRPAGPSGRLDSGGSQNSEANLSFRSKKSGSPGGSAAGGPAAVPTAASASKPSRESSNPVPKMAPLTAGPTSTGQADMNALTNIIRTALSKSLEDIHVDLMEELQRLRAEFQSLVGGKAGVHELLALSSRVDAWSQQGRSRFAQRMRDRSISPDEGDSRTDFGKHRGKLPTTLTGPTRERGHSCHEKCKSPTCPKALAMSQSLSRLPALKVPQ